MVVRRTASGLLRFTSGRQLVVHAFALSVCFISNNLELTFDTSRIKEVNTSILHLIDTGEGGRDEQRDVRKFGESA